MRLLHGREISELSSRDEQEFLRKRVGEVGAERDGEELSKQRNSICRNPRQKAHSIWKTSVPTSREQTGQWPGIKGRAHRVRTLAFILRGLTC